MDEECAKLISLAVHELRTPMSVVSGYLRMLLAQKAGGLSEAQARLVAEAERSAARLAAVIAELADVVKLDASQAVSTRQDILLSSLLAEVAAGVHEGRDRGIRLEVQGPAGEPLIVGDRDRLRKALRAILVANLRERPDDEVVIASGSIRELGGRPAVCVVVADAAQALTMSSFNPPDWSRFDQWRGGNGLSLVLAARVIAAHGGQTWSLRTPRGTADAVALPLKDAPP